MKTFKIYIIIIGFFAVSLPAYSITEWDWLRGIHIMTEANGLKFNAMNTELDTQTARLDTLITAVNDIEITTGELEVTVDNTELVNQLQVIIIAVCFINAFLLAMLLNAIRDDTDF